MLFNEVILYNKKYLEEFQIYSNYYTNFKISNLNKIMYILYNGFFLLILKFPKFKIIFFSKWQT